MRITWISRINAALSGIAEAPKYGVFIKKLIDKKIKLNRKVLSALAVNLPEAFQNVVSFTGKK